MFIFTGFGCKNALTDDQSKAVKPVSLEYWTVFDDVGAINSAVTNFKTYRPYVTINVKQFKAEEIYDRLLEALAEDRGPDIISVPVRQLSFYQSKLATMPTSVSDAIVETKKTMTGSIETTVSLRAVNLPTALNIEREFFQTVKKDAIKNGNIYGLPLSLDSMVLYYNKDILDRAGVPEPPRTWSEFQDAVKKTTRFNKETGKIIQSGAALGTAKNINNFDDIFYVLLKQSGVALGQGGFVWSGDKKENPIRNVLDFYTDFSNSGRDTYSWNNEQEVALDRFFKGGLAFFFGYNYHYNLIKAQGANLNFDVIPLLQLNPENPVNVTNYSLQCVTAKSKNQDQAWNFINYLANLNVKDYLDKTGRPTAKRAFLVEQKGKTELAPFVNDLLIVENWYRGNNYEASKSALDLLYSEWVNIPASDRENDIENWREEVLNRAATKINQTY
ncbi:MAG: extracellular solute-binding protein [Candidatus Magasanikbacteria bacterium]|nr:extracellular solute-binding protein [Candidatus Magasanikbacteria bacterium]